MSKQQLISLNSVTLPFLLVGFKKQAFYKIVTEIDPSISLMDLNLAWNLGVLSADVLRKMDYVVETLKNE